MESLAGKTSEEVEAAATDITDLLGVLAGWEPDNGSYNWECRDAILKWTFYTSVPISILHPIRKLDTADQIFKYLAKCFRDSEPIPHANEFQRAGTATAVETPENCPASTDAATELHACAEWDEDDLSTTKALTRGTKSIDNGIVRHQDPRTSLEASAQGTSAKCIETTAVVLESTPHEMQNWSQYSLPLTPRLPIEGEPSGCKQEVADSVMTAERTNGTVKLAKPNESDADVDGKAMLGSEPATVACGVDEGAETERNATQLQQTNLLCGGIIQCSENTNKNIPNAYGVLLKGEWTVCSSGEVSNYRKVESEGCKKGASESTSVDEAEMAVWRPAECCQQLGVADGDTDCGVEPVDVPIESETLVVVSIKSEGPDGGDIPCICLRGTCMRPGDMNGLGCLTDGLGAQVDASNASSNPETADISHADGAETYLRLEDVKHLIYESDGTRIHANMLTGHGDIPNVTIYAVKPTNKMGNVRTCRIRQRTENSPNAPKNGMSKPIRRWRMVSIGEANMYLLLNAPVEASGTASRTLAFGEVESGDEVIAPSVEGKGAVDGNGDQDGDGGGVDGTTSGGGIHSTRVNAALLAAESQHMHQSRRKRIKGLPMSSEPPIQSAERPNGAVRRRRRCRRIKLEAKKSQSNGNERKHSPRMQAHHAATPKLLETSRASVQRC
ncbi:hypothetical protein SCLCIDRAFT_33747 [Scleroderma citrinum Foug A]|uniref:Uncharacterized protein n=1 Tax=Scleroderma citrinum Foug A TaxID=1036808 RepID=A0A0C2ZDP8_9AGAM|nr:hypothetical protein SCLCIDRAFT_33747 [Scleroderma citrinum Foug A]